MLNKQTMITAQEALPGRNTPLIIDDSHFVNQSSLTAEPPQGCEQVLFGMGCFWGAERLFWQLDGVVSTSVGYSGGFTPNPTYQEDSDEQYQTASASKQAYQALLGDDVQSITTEILPAGKYYYAENYHQQYLAKNPNGYCGLGGTGVCFPPQ